jgi:hypothetical protein
MSSSCGQPCCCKALPDAVLANRGGPVTSYATLLRRVWASSTGCGHDTWRQKGNCWAVRRGLIRCSRPWYCCLMHRNPPLGRLWARGRGYGQTGATTLARCSHDQHRVV